MRIPKACPCRNLPAYTRPSGMRSTLNSKLCSMCSRKIPRRSTNPGLSKAGSLSPGRLKLMATLRLSNTLSSRALIQLYLLVTWMTGSALLRWRGWVKIQSWPVVWKTSFVAAHDLQEVVYSNWASYLVRASSNRPNRPVNSSLVIDSISDIQVGRPRRKAGYR